MNTTGHRTSCSWSLIMDALANIFLFDLLEGVGILLEPLVGRDGPGTFLIGSCLREVKAGCDILWFLHYQGLCSSLPVTTGHGIYLSHLSLFGNSLRYLF